MQEAFKLHLVRVNDSLLCLNSEYSSTRSFDIVNKRTPDAEKAVMLNSDCSMNRD